MLNQEGNAQAVNEGVPSYLVLTVGIGVILTACLHMVKIMGLSFIAEDTLLNLFFIWSGMLMLSTYLLATTKKS